MTNEAFSRVRIDALLTAQGWDTLNTNAVRFEVMLPDGTRADHVLRDRRGRSIAVIEAKRFSANPGDAAAQAKAYRHSVRVKWLNTEVPRSTFDQDLLYSFGAFMTVCRMARNDAEARVRGMARAGWKAQTAGAVAPAPGMKNKSASSDQPLVIEEHFDVERSGGDSPCPSLRRSRRCGRLERIHVFDGDLGLPRTRERA